MAADRSSRWIALALLLLVAVLAAGQAMALRGRVYSAEQVEITAASPLEAYEALADQGVKGRVLVLLDDRTRIVPRTWMATFMDSLQDPTVEPPVMKHNFTSCLMYAGIAREVYFCPPDGAWQTELDRMSRRPDSFPEGNGARVRFYGTPVHLIRSADIPVFSEKVVVYIAEGAASRYDAEFMAAITDSAVADVVVRQVTE